VIDAIVIDGSRQQGKHDRQNGKDTAHNHGPAPPRIEQQRSIQLGRK